MINVEVAPQSTSCADKLPLKLWYPVDDYWKEMKSEKERSEFDGKSDWEL